MSNSNKGNNQIPMVESKMVEKVAIDIKENGPLETEKSDTSLLSPQPRRLVSKVNIDDESTKPDYQLFKKRMGELHARNNKQEPYSCSEACCSTTTGWHFCCSTTQRSDIDKFGVGIVQYFRFLKFFAGFFFLASILSIPVLYFCIRMSYTLPEAGMKDIKDGLYYTTLGSIAIGSNQCAKVSVEDLDPLNANLGRKDIEFSCQLGRIGSFATLNYGRVTEELSITCEYFTSFSWDKACNKADANANEIRNAFQPCEGQQSCTFQVTEDFFDFSPNACRPWDPTSPSKVDTNTFYFQILCEDIEIELPGGYTIDKVKMGWIVVSFDALISALFLLFLLCLKVYEKKTVINVLGNNEGIESFTVEVRSLPTNMPMVDLKAKLWNHFSSLVLKGGKKIHLSVVDVQLAETNALLALNAELGALKEKKVKIYRKFFKKWSNGNSPAVSEVQYEDLYALAKSNGKNALKAFKPIEKLKAKQDKLEEKVNKLKNDKNSRALSAFVTFDNKKDRDTVYYHYQKSPLTRCCFSLGCCKFRNDPNYFEGKYLKVSAATDPSNIIWENMNVGRFNKLLRRLLSWGITFILWVISFIFMNVVRNEQDKLADRVQPIRDCSAYENNPLSIADVEADMALGVNGVGKLECYCRQFSFADSFDYPCRDWALDRILMTALPFVIVFVVLIINIILQYVFKFLSSFEKHRSASSESVSKILKIFVAQALNTGIIILIVNAKFGKKSVPNLFEGTFDDVTPEWFWIVATTILITMIINIVNVPIVMLLVSGMRALLQCFDRGCTCRRERTKKKTQKAWENLYTGPEFLIEFRYSQVLTMIFVCMFYSAGIPLLYISTCVNLFLFYWLDKICLLRLYRKPKNYDQKMQALVRRSLYFALLLHLGNAVWMYGQQQIFGGEADSMDSASSLISKISGDDTPGIFAKLLARAVQSQNISLSIIFLIVLIGIIIRVFFDSTLQNLYRMVTKKKGKNNSNKYQAGQTNYYNKIKRDDLLAESQYLEKEIQATKNDQLKQHYLARSQKLNEELSTRKDINEKPRERFPGMFSYNVGHNPLYKRYTGYTDVRGNSKSTSPVKIKECK